MIFVQELLVNLKVIPNSKEFCVSGFDTQSNSLKIKTKAKAVGGKANKEAIKKLEKMLGCQVKIVSGFRSRNKKIILEKNQKVIDFRNTL